MKKLGFFLVVCTLMVLPMGCGTDSNEVTLPTEAANTDNVAEADTETNEEEDQMKVTSSGIRDGVIDPKYGKNGDMVTDGVPTLSLPLAIENAPENTACYAIFMDDPDAKPLAGFNWVHWAAVNIETTDMPEGFSTNAPDGVVQGKNDNGTVGYAGPAPPDKDHTYIIVVYALDAKIDLENGFAKDVFHNAIDGHVLASATLEAVYVK